MASDEKALSYVKDFKDEYRLQCITAPYDELSIKSFSGMGPVSQDAADQHQSERAFIRTRAMLLELSLANYNTVARRKRGEYAKLIAALCLHEVFAEQGEVKRRPAFESIRKVIVSDPTQAQEAEKFALESLATTISMYEPLTDAAINKLFDTDS